MEQMAFKEKSQGMMVSNIFGRQKNLLNSKPELAVGSVSSVKFLNHLNQILIPSPSQISICMCVFA